VIVAKYDLLADWLRSQKRLPITALIDDPDSLVAGLPPSARADRTWWGNTTNRKRVQAQAWLCAGWRVDDGDLIHEPVTVVLTEPRRTSG